MAGDWIKMRADLLTHPKVVRITSALKADRLRTVGGLMAAWCLFDAHSIDGRLDGYTTSALDDLIGWPGFSAEMVKVGWLEINGDSLSTPRFTEHNGQSAKRRATETERKRMARDLSASDADEKRTREEKRREEKKEREPRATRLPAPFVLEPEWREWAIKTRPDLIPDTTAAKFADYWHSKPGKDGRKLDWLATWRNWVREERPPKTSPVDVARQTVQAKPRSDCSYLNEAPMTSEQRQAANKARELAVSAFKTTRAAA